MKIKGKRNQREHLKLAKMRRVCKNQKKLLERLKIKKMVKNEYNQEKLWKMLKTNRLWKLKEIVKDFENQEKMWKMKMVGPHFRFSCDRPQPSRPHSHHSIFCCSPLIEDDDEHWHLDFYKYKKIFFSSPGLPFYPYNWLNWWNVCNGIHIFEISWIEKWPKP